MKYHHLFGPVASRRLGISLGVDLVVHKICSLDCVYCECGKTTDLTPERRAYVSFDRVKEELDHYWAHNEDPDYITFSGSGEPTLNKEMGRVIDYIKDSRPGIRVAMLTNATLLTNPDVRRELARVDLLVPSLDAVSETAFRKINRPCAQLRAGDVARGIREMARGFKGEIWLEIFILPGVNDTQEELDLLRAEILKIQPHRVQLNTLDRPGTLSTIRPASREELESVATYLGMENLEIIAKVKKKAVKTPVENLEAAVLETIHRRPCTREDLTSMLGANERTITELLEALLAQGRIEITRESRGEFYRTIKE